QTILLSDGEAFRAHPQAGLDPRQRPAAIAVPRSVDEVRAVIEHAGERGWRVAVHTTGRGVRQTGPLDETLLVRTDRLAGAALDAPLGRVRVGGGARWAEVSAAAAPAGLAALSIPTPGVGVAGTVLAGGVGWLGRRHGLASESLLAAELVTADGALLRADEERERDLWWALRGGGGGLGVVTALELAVVDPGPLHAGVLSWPAARAAEVLHAWRAWTATVPREVTSLARLVGGGDPLPAVHVEAVLLAAPAAADALLAPLRELGPATDTFRAAGPEALDALHFDVLGDRPVHYDHLLLDQLPAEALDDFLDAAGPAAGVPLLDVELRHLGGALDERAKACGALGALDAGYLLVVAAAPDRASVAQEVVEALSPWAAGHIFLSFAGDAAAGADVFVSDALRRLRAVKALYDPADRFVSPLDGGPR
ncbi:MAG TPA: FAD-binding protein, partial [Capillimicrobium sp.]